MMRFLLNALSVPPKPKVVTPAEHVNFTAESACAAWAAILKQKSHVPNGKRNTAIMCIHKAFVASGGSPSKNKSPSMLRIMPQP